jgi:hypothetical protein
MPNPYIIGGVSILVALMAWRLFAAHERIGELEAKLEVQAAETLEATNANDSNQLTIEGLTERIDIMVEQRRVDAEERERILVERDEIVMRLRMESDRLREERQDEIMENTDCAELSALRVSDFCPSTGRQLRLRSGGQGGDRDTDSS